AGAAGREAGLTGRGATGDCGAGWAGRGAAAGRWAGREPGCAGAAGRGACFAWLPGPGGAADAVFTPTLKPINPAARIFSVRFMVGTSRCNRSGSVVPFGPVS